MSIGKRILQLLRSGRRGRQDTQDLKDRLDETYRKQLGLLQQIRRGVADVVTSRKRVEIRIAEMQQQISALDAEAREYVAAGNDDAAREVLRRQVSMSHAAADLTDQHASLKVEEDRLTGSAESLEREIEAFRTRKDTLTARRAAAEARAELHNAESGITSASSKVGQAMAEAERHTRELEAQADAVDELVSQGIIVKQGETSDEAERRRFDALLSEVEGETGGPQQISQ